MEQNVEIYAQNVKIDQQILIFSRETLMFSHFRSIQMKIEQKT